MASPDGDDYEWQPPTEAEMKILQARRDRSDKISKLMGVYLLKGYKMLGSTCPTCLTILLQDREGSKYCVACSELDADGNKDDPALSREAARRQVAEERERGVASDSCSPDSPSTPGARFDSLDNPPPPPPRVSVPSRTASIPESVVTTTAHSTASGGAPSYQGQYHNIPSSTQTVIIQAPPKVVNGNHNVASSGAMATMDMSQPIMSVKTKLNWACAELDRATSLDNSIQLCQLIKSCADALMSLQTLHVKPGQSG